MTTGHVFIAISLDGFIAREDGDIGWLEAPDTRGEDHGYEAFTASVDGIVMGRGSFEKVLEFDAWPYAKPVIVLTRSLTPDALPGPLPPGVTLSAETPAELMARLDGEGWSRAYVDGGKVIRSFLRAGLIADMVLTRLPVLLGQGLPLFGPLDHDINLSHIATRSFASGLVQSDYAVRRSP